MELSKRLGLMPNSSALVVGAPDSYIEELQPLPAGVEIRTDPKGRYRFLHFFATTRDELDQFIEVAATHCLPQGKIWLSYPSSAEALATHFRSEPYSRKMQDHGLVVSAQMPLDHRWIAFRLRREERRQPIQALQPTRGDAIQNSGSPLQPRAPRASG